MISQDEAPQPNGLVVVTGDSTLSRAIPAALSHLAEHRTLLPGAGEIEIIAPDHRRRPLLKAAVTEVRRELTLRYPDTAILSLPEDRDSVLEGWQEVTAPAGTERFGEILVPSWWSPSTRRCLVTTVPRRSTAPRFSPMFVLASLAHARQRLAARFHRNRVALAAELASPWRVDLYVIVASRPPHRTVAATHDLIAAELVWLALAAGDEADEDVGPWEDPAVQRATQLGMGVLGPHQVSMSTTPGAIKPGVTDLLAARLGVIKDR